MGLLVLNFIVGCGSPPVATSDKGPNDNKTEKAAQTAKVKPPFETFRVFTEPNERSTVDKKQKDAGRIVQAIKPGHWANLLVETKANNFDFVGELTTSPLDSQQRPARLEQSPFSLVASRPVTLAKAQPKTLESVLFPPRSCTHEHDRLESSYRSSAGEQSPAFPEVLSHMPDYQYFMIVLSKDPNRYRGLKSLEAVRRLGENMPLNPEDAAYYRVVIPRADQSLALPSDPLCWSSTAYVLWDDVLPSAPCPSSSKPCSTGCTGAAG